MVTPIIAPEQLLIPPATQLILASQSPRRRDLLAQLRLIVHSITADINETPLTNEQPIITLQRLAQLKADAVYARVHHRTSLPILAADTGIIIDNQLLGQPRDIHDAIAMWQRLSDRWHHVITAVVLLHDATRHAFICTTAVKMRMINTTEAAAYWATGEPQDKAGGYAIQGLGAVFIERIIGSYSNVVGLPLFETAALLHTAGIYLLTPAVPTR